MYMYFVYCILCICVFYCIYTYISEESIRSYYRWLSHYVVART